MSKGLFLLGKYFTEDDYAFAAKNEDWEQFVPTALFAKFLHRIIVPGLPDEISRDSSQCRILIEMFSNVIRFSLDQSFSYEKMSTLYGIFHQTHFESMKPHFQVKAALQRFTDLIMQHSVHRPPFSIQIFAAPDISEIMEFIVRTYIRVFKLFLYAFTPRPVLNVVTRNVGIEFPTKLAPLSEAKLEIIEPEPEEDVEEAIVEEEEATDVPDTVVDDVIDQMAAQGDIDKAKLKEAIKLAMQSEMDKFKKTISEQVAQALADKGKGEKKEEG